MGLYFIKIICLLLPWKIRRVILNRILGYQIHKSARIGFSWIYPQYLAMGAGAKIASFTIAIHLDKLVIGENSFVGRNNWITGFPKNTDSKHFFHQSQRMPELIIGKESAITKNHHIDCTNKIEIGNFVTIAGYNTQLLTHSIDIYENRQDSKPIKIKDYTFIGTNCVILGGAQLPAYSVLGAKSLLNKYCKEEWCIYAGTPAIKIKEISRDAKYFSRKDGYVY